MDNKSLIDELKDVCNKIVGKWHSNDGTQTLIFSFTDELLKQADLIVINKDKTPIQTHYKIGTLPQVQPKADTVFYFEIGFTASIKYVITSLTKDRMDVHLYNYYDPSETKIYYIRKIDVDFADEILQGLYSI